MKTENIQKLLDKLKLIQGFDLESDLAEALKILEEVVYEILQNELDELNEDIEDGDEEIL
jgi:hypothetical protein